MSLPEQGEGQGQPALWIQHMVDSAQVVENFLNVGVSGRPLVGLEQDKVGQ